MICMISDSADISHVTLMIIYAETLCHTGICRNDTGCTDQCTLLSGNLYVCFAVDLTFPDDLTFGNLSADRLLHFLCTDIDMSVNTFGLRQPYIPAGDPDCMCIAIFNQYAHAADQDQCVPRNTLQGLFLVAHADQDQSGRNDEGCKTDIHLEEDDACQHGQDPDVGLPDKAQDDNDNENDLTIRFPYP